jgi:hypothetical protein
MDVRAAICFEYFTEINDVGDQAEVEVIILKGITGLKWLRIV